MNLDLMGDLVGGVSIAVEGVGPGTGDADTVAHDAHAKDGVWTRRAWERDHPEVADRSFPMAADGRRWKWGCCREG